MSLTLSDHFRFGPFTLSPRSRALATADGPVPMSSRAFDLLVALIERRDEVVTKDQLMRCVWANLVVEENNLHVQIAAIRKALGAHQAWIKTIPGRGYRFIGEVLEAGAAPPAPLAPFPCGDLPAELTELIGRQAERTVIATLLAQTRLVTLVGPGGVGKTKLALAVARRFAAGAEGAAAALVELGAVADGAAVPAAVAASLRIEELQGRSLNESTVMALRQRRMLLLLDGCEHVAPAVAAFAGLLLQTCPQVRILCTSQAPLGLEGETIRRIAPLDLPDETIGTAAAALAYDAVRLFAARAAAGDGRFVLDDAAAPSVIAICRGLDGIPLAIELAAARVALLGLEPVRLRLVSRLARLGGADSEAGGQPERHRTLGAAIEWSYGLLAETDRHILRRLSVFAGGFTLDAAREVAAGAGFGEADIERGVETLARRSLLTMGADLMRPRHRMLEVMRGFALGELAKAGEQEAAQRQHAIYFCRLAHAAEETWQTSASAEWTRPFAAELDNLRAALAWALSPAGDPLLAARLAAATARFWFEGTYLREGEAWLRRAHDGAPPELEASTMVHLKRGLAELSGGEAAVTLARAAMALARAEGLAEDEGACARVVASSLIQLGRLEEAETAAERAFALLRDGGAQRTFARCLCDLSLLRGFARDYAGARRHNAEAQARLKAIGDDVCAATCLQHAAEFEFADGNSEQAIALAEDSVMLLRPLNRRYDLQVSLGNLAAYLAAARNFAAAREAAREALLFGQQIEDALGIIIAIEHLALAAAGTGAPEAAARLLGFAEAARATLGQERQQTEAITHRLLLAALDCLPPRRRESLLMEGSYLTEKSAIAEALRV